MEAVENEAGDKDGVGNGFGFAGPLRVLSFTEESSLIRALPDPSQILWISRHDEFILVMGNLLWRPSGDSPIFGIPGPSWNGTWMDAYGSAVLRTLYNSLTIAWIARVVVAAVIAAWVAALGAAYPEAEAYSGYYRLTLLWQHYACSLVCNL